MHLRRVVALAAAPLAVTIALAGCGSNRTTTSGDRKAAAHVSATVSATGIVNAVGAENEYANVISQIGGRYVKVTAIMSNPNTDPHTFEASPAVAKVVSAANLVVQNGLGYDTFMNKIESASPSSARRVIDVQELRHLPDSTPNPHLWYSPETMPAVAQALVKDLSSIQPSHAAYFQANEVKFVKSLGPWLADIAAFKKQYADTPVATTEPVGDYMLEAAGTENLTPFKLQADIMNGVDPAPQFVSLQNNLFSGHKVKVFVYNQQVTDSLTASFLAAAKSHDIPVVGVYETMPTPGYDYQSWMVAEVEALERAVADHRSTQKL
jgi:zinc/manganese transport system substrate-binding protein